MSEDMGLPFAEFYREQAKRSPETLARERALVMQVFQEAFERIRKDPPPRPPSEPATIHYTELPEAKPGDVLFHEWNAYRREASRLLAEGHEGRFVLFKGEVIIGIWETEEEARAVAMQKYWMQPCLIHQVRSREPLLRLPMRLWPCQS